MATPRYAAFQSVPFRALWLGMVVSNVGSLMQVAGQGWLIRDLSPDPLALGLVSLAGALPMIFLTPLGGVFADRFRRRRLLWCTQTGMLLQAAVLAALTVSGQIRLWHVVVLAALGATLLAVDNPTRQALLPDLVTQAQLPSAVSLNSVVWSGAALFGPALAGVLLGPLGPGGLFILNALSYLAVMYALTFMRSVPDEPHPRPDAVLAGVRNGLVYTFSDRLSRSVLLLLVLTGLFGRSYQTLMPIFARDVLQVGATGYGLLLAAPGAGAMIGGFGLAGVRGNWRPDRVLLGGLMGFCGVVLAFSISGSLALDLGLLVLTGACNTLSATAAATLLQLHSPRPLRGRVMSLATVANIGLSQLGGLLSASAATLVGAPAAVGAGALIAGTLGLVIGLAPGWRHEAATLRPATAE